MPLEEPVLRTRTRGESTGTEVGVLEDGPSGTCVEGIGIEVVVLEEDTKLGIATPGCTSTDEAVELSSTG